MNVEIAVSTIETYTNGILGEDFFMARSHEAYLLEEKIKKRKEDAIAELRLAASDVDLPEYLGRLSEDDKAVVNGSFPDSETILAENTSSAGDVSSEASAVVEETEPAAPAESAENATSAEGTETAEEILETPTATVKKKQRVTRETKKLAKA